MPTYRTQVTGTFDVTADVIANSEEEATSMLTCMLTAVDDEENVTNLTTHFNSNIFQTATIVETPRPQIQHRDYVSMAEVLRPSPTATIPSTPSVDGYTRLVN